jgi:SH3-like domain-containing protein
MINIRPILLSVNYKNFLFNIFYILAAIFLAFSFAPMPSAHGSSEVIGTITIPIGNLRSKPTLYSSIIYKLKKGDSVTFLKRKDEWYVIKLSNGLAGWAYQSLFLDEGSPPEINKPFLEMKEIEIENKITLRVSIGRVRERPSRNADIMHELKNGETVSVIEIQGEWNLIELKDSRLGWAHQSLFIESPREQVSTAKPETKVETIPETKSETSPEAIYNTKIVTEIKEIEYIMTPEGKEMVSFLLNGNYPPKTFSIAGKRPKVICDFFNARLGKGVERFLKVDGKLVHQIRIGIHKGSRPKIRVVVDLVEHDEVEIRPMFFEDDNLYTLIVGKAK